MTATLAHRGPDGAGTELFTESGCPPAAFGHRRLSIIDLSERGAQPMAYADGRYWITYNGEIYNYAQLRAELEGDGYTFASATDTEVILALYARDGERSLDRLNGIFAFAIWDTERGELFMARDRVGVKPLYYAERNGTLYFASEAKSILKAFPRPGLNHAVLDQYLSFLWVPDPDTLFEGVYKLPPGHCATYSDGTLQVRSYWDFRFDIDEVPTGFEWSWRVRSAVQGSVFRQMMSDVPLGAFLSGGVDSAAIVRSMKMVTDDVTTYTAGFSKADLAAEIVPDDLHYSRFLADRLSLDYHERILEANIVDLLPRLVWHMDEPVADPAMITTYLICSAAKERATVLLSGMGGDELFGGYPRYLAARFGRTVDLAPTHLRASIKHGLEERLTMGRPGALRGPRRNLMKFVRGLDLPHLDRYLTFSSYYTPAELAGLFHGELRAGFNGGDPYRRHREHAAQVSSGHWLDQLLYLDLKTFLPCLNLTYTDKMSMAASTEVRVPLLDDELLGLAAQIPAQMKLRGTTRKYILKRSMRGVLPERILHRRKAGFGAPVRAWMGHELRPMIEDLLSQETVRRRGLFEPEAVAEMIRANDAGTEDNTLRIWALMVLELWQQEFLDA
ncbi:MAG: asparagine synthase (glutamine-hydrolyzing) [Chloroflexota bacterium]|nr:asparagine synthase (glutamine-hydrolyzing) [Chloroflexota bacterium]